MYLREIRLTRAAGEAYPFNVYAIATLSSLQVRGGVIFLAGENGAGKSTLLEAIARRMRMPALGYADAGADSTLSAVDPLAESLELIWNRKAKRGFFLRAEDFFGFTRRVSQTQSEMRQELSRVKREYEGRSAYARQLARMPYEGSLAQMRSRYGDDPDARSHGESFLSVFGSRMVPGGFYLLDEPEAALSPTSQMALLTMLYALRDSCQFIIATHSPILLAYPGAEIWHFREDAPIETAAWADLPGVRQTRDFLGAPERFLRQLLSEGDAGD